MATRRRRRAGAAAAAITIAALAGWYLTRDEQPAVPDGTVSTATLDASVPGATGPVHVHFDLTEATAGATDFEAAHQLGTLTVTELADRLGLDDDGTGHIDRAVAAVTADTFATLSVAGGDPATVAGTLARAYGYDLAGPVRTGAGDVPVDVPIHYSGLPVEGITLTVTAGTVTVAVIDNLTPVARARTPTLLDPAATLAAVDLLPGDGTVAADPDRIEICTSCPTQTVTVTVEGTADALALARDPDSGPWLIPAVQVSVGDWTATFPRPPAR